MTRFSLCDLGYCKCRLIPKAAAEHEDWTLRSEQTVEAFHSVASSATLRVGTPTSRTAPPGSAPSSGPGGNLSETVRRT